jgi:hypothetical protein
VKKNAGSFLIIAFLISLQVMQRVLQRKG